VTVLVAFLLAANIFNIGADLSAMAAAAQLVAGGGGHVLVIAFALLCVLLQLFVPYRRYAQVLKWLTLSLFAYVAVLFLVHVDWPSAVAGMLWPHDLTRAGLLTVVALLGTTISPYLFFWQSSQEAEEIATTPGVEPLKQSPHGISKQYRQIRFDTFFGMAFSNLIALAIMIATAATLHARGITDIRSAADAAEALRPVAGRFASLAFAIGIIGTGLLAVPVLAGSAAFAVGETRGWKTGLEYKPAQAVRFYSIIVAAVAIGIVLNWSNMNPIKALFYSAVLNGVSAVPIMAAMMIVASRSSVMGHLRERPMLLAWGWAATLIMAAASIAMLASLLG
jgi:Mn2+/Fe2+ NRAMP family transporter